MYCAYIHMLIYTYTNTHTYTYIYIYIHIRLAPRGTRLCVTFVPILSSCHSVPFWSVRSCLLAYCGVLISVFLFSGLPAICLLVASGPRALVITLQ